MTNLLPRNRTFLLAAVSGLLILGMVVPTTAAGQALPGCDVVAQATVTLAAGISDPIPPETMHTVTVDYEYSVPDLAWSIEPITLTFDLDGVPGWADVALSETTVYKEVDPAGETTMAGNVVLHMSVIKDAPAYERSIFHLSVESSEGTCVAPAAATADVEITPGFHEDWKAEINPEPIRVAVGDIVAFEAVITNLGNGAIEVGIETQQSPANGELVFPKGFSAVGSEAQGHENLRKLDLQYRAENAGEETITLLITGRSMDNPNVALGPKEVTFTVQASHFEDIATQEIPTPILPIVLITLGLVLLRAQRRR